jgi:hypothetical protein
LTQIFIVTFQESTALFESVDFAIVNFDFVRVLLCEILQLGAGEVYLIRSFDE